MKPETLEAYRKMIGVVTCGLFAFATVLALLLVFYPALVVEILRYCLLAACGVVIVTCAKTLISL